MRGDQVHDAFDFREDPVDEMNGRLQLAWILQVSQADGCREMKNDPTKHATTWICRACEPWAPPYRAFRGKVKGEGQLTASVGPEHHVPASAV